MVWKRECARNNRPLPRYLLHKGADPADQGGGPYSKPASPTLTRTAEIYLSMQSFRCISPVRTHQSTHGTRPVPEPLAWPAAWVGPLVSASQPSIRDERAEATDGLVAGPSRIPQDLRPAAGPAARTGQPKAQGAVGHPMIRQERWRLQCPSPRSWEG